MTKYFSKQFLSFYDDAQISKASMPNDVIVISDATYKAMKSAIASGKVITTDANGQPMAVEPTATPVVKMTLDQTITTYSSVLSKSINDLAISWGYDNITSAATYLNSTSAQYAADAKALINYRDTAWSAADNLWARVKAGTSQTPATSSAFLAIVLPPTPSRPVV